MKTTKLGRALIAGLTGLRDQLRDNVGANRCQVCNRRSHGLTCAKCLRMVRQGEEDIKAGRVSEFKP